MKVLAIHGSLRRDSFTGRLARAAGAVAGDGIEIENYENLGEIPGFNEDLETEGLPPAVEDLRARLAGSDALLIVTPEYNASAPGALKNAIDWASRPHGNSALAGLPTAIVSASPMPFGAIWANEQIRKAFTITGTPTVERELAIGKIDGKLGEGDTISDPEVEEQLGMLLTELGDLAETVREAEAGALDPTAA
ncbi:MAG: NAD(P)H-dependent oxidoreductase [Solirubrobacterales bacterium]|nr:NAD(P)H-dependent oxidoreductase [Solirubrobacterales bacterium]